MGEGQGALLGGWQDNPDVEMLKHWMRVKAARTHIIIAQIHLVGKSFGAQWFNRYGRGEEK